MNKIQEEFLLETESYYYYNITIPVAIPKEYAEEFGVDDSIKEQIKNSLSNIKEIKLMQPQDDRKELSLLIGEEKSMKVRFGYHEDDDTRGITEWNMSLLCRYIKHLEALLPKSDQVTDENLIKELQYISMALQQWQTSGNGYQFVIPSPTPLDVAAYKIKDILLKLTKNNEVSNEIHG